jgi:hypothetical protein
VERDALLIFLRFCARGYIDVARPVPKATVIASGASDALP